jgi:ATP-binding cassette subfamily F protein uup
VLLRLDAVSLAFGSRPLLERASLQVGERERVCLVGRNGEGKSSLLRLVAGAAQPDDGSVWIRPGARLATLAQDLDAVADGRVADIVRGGLAPEADGGWETAHRVDAMLSRLGLDGTRHLAGLSGGWRRRVLLARALVGDPDILLLDEPTNHLDIETIEWLEETLLGFRGASLLVSHDRAFVNRLATRVVELDRGRLSSWPGNYDDYAARKTLQLANEAKANAEFDRKLAEEEVWIRKGVEARRTRNEGRVRALQAMRRERRERRERIGQAGFGLVEAAESAKCVFEADRAGVAFEGREVLSGFSARIQRGDRIGIVGPNGAGKSTLIRLLLGALEPTAGSVTRGARLETAYYDQQREQLDLSASVADNVNDGNSFVPVGGEDRHVSGYLRDFLFRPDQLLTPAAALSGGERNRLLLARLFARPANLLVMDEPTNDLDIDTLELLEDRIASFEGTLLLVSHDRAFLDRVVTSLLVLEGDGRVQEFVGGWSDWRAWRDAREAGRRAAGTATTAAATKPRGTAAAPDAPRSSRPRLSYKTQREFDSLPARIEELESVKAALDALVAEPSFYSGDRETVRETLARVPQLAAEIDTAYARWAELEALGAKASGGR